MTSRPQKLLIHLDQNFISEIGNQTKMSENRCGEWIELFGFDDAGWKARDVVGCGIGYPDPVLLIDAEVGR